MPEKKEEQKTTITIEKADFDNQIARAGETRLTTAIESGEVIPKDKVDEMVRVGVMKELRTQAVDSLDVDDATANEYRILSLNDELHPYTEEGQTAFKASFQRWSSLIKKGDDQDDSDEDPKETKDGDQGGDDAGGKKTASTGDGTQDDKKEGDDFTPGSGGSETSGGDGSIKRFGMNK
jgi:hypothetical protein